MPSEAKPLLTAQTEKPNHYKYLKEFRVEQCPSFLQHKCTQHRPFTCFHWHFNNQRRRRPVRKRDGSFNYSADNYCTKYNETSGVCEDGDECPFLHRTAGDTERRYHLRYYKTCMCVHDTDARGFCVKNGPHCAFAHGNSDLRPPVYDIKEIQALENSEAEANGATNGPNVLDKERNLITEDPKWQDTNYVLSSYKTEACKRPPRLCRQGYACPQYHNSKDKRRSPRKHKYRSTPCPNVKHGEEWGEPSNCDAGDSCAYCHTRTEQQFHPEIYKSTKCNDVQQAGYCPRGFFCAFAHVEPEETAAAREMSGPLECGANFADILSSALPPDKKSSESSNGSGEASESASTSSLGSSGGARAPGAPLTPHAMPLAPAAPRHPLLRLPPPPLNHAALGHAAHAHAPHAHSPHATHAHANHSNLAQAALAQLAHINASNNLLDSHNDHKGSMVAWHTPSQTTQSNVTSATQAPGSVQQQSFDTAILTTVVGNALEDMQLEEPVQLVASLDRDLSEGEGGAGGAGGAGGRGMASPFLRYRGPADAEEAARLRDELQLSRAAAARWDERIAQARSACDAWKRESDDAHRKAEAAERQRDEALALGASLRRELEARAAGLPPSARDLRTLPITALKALKERLHVQLEEIEKVLYLETATKCMACEEHNRSVTLAPCNHYVLCEGCAATQKECPYCQTPVSPSN